MFLMIIGIVCITIGYFFLMLTTMFPILRLVFFDWIASIFFILPWIIVLYRLWVTDSWKQADRIPTWKHLMNYLRRDNEIIPMVSERAYPGESFIDVPDLGLMEFLGKDCVYTQGDKKVVWGLENVNFTPDPRYFNFTYLLWELGLSNSNDVKNVLTGEDLFLMGRVYLAMDEWDGGHGVKKLVTDMESYSGKVVDFKPTLKENIHRKVDHILDKKR